MEEKDARSLYRRPLTSGGVAVVAILVVAGALLALLSAVIFFIGINDLGQDAPTFIILFFVGCALVLIGAIVKLFLNKQRTKVFRLVVAHPVIVKLFLNK